MSTKNMTKASGFSLIELMVVIAIVALLAAVAVPSYKSYITRSKVAEINSLAGSQMQAWALAYDQGTLPTDTGALGSYIASVAFTSAGLDITLVGATGIDTALDGAILEFTATPGDTTVTWACDVTDGTDPLPEAAALIGGVCA